MADIDRNTGLPVGASGLAASIGFTQTGTQSSGPNASVKQSTGTDRTTQSSSQSSSQINTTPGALAALQSLITQLTDRPNVNEAELNSKFPLAQRTFNPNLGWVYIDPSTGNQMDNTAAAAFNAKQQVARDKAVAAGGVTAGGTEATKAQQADRQTEITRDRALQGDYSKGAAMSDAEFLVHKSIADALEAAMPQITAGLEGAGTSKSTIGAALTQKAATKGATEGAALGANLGVQYGGISTQLAGVLEALTRSDPNSPAALLLQALNTSKGMVQAGTSSSVQSSTSTKSGQEIGATDGGDITTTQTRTPSMPTSPFQIAAASTVAKATQQASNPYMSISFNDPQSPVSPVNNVYNDIITTPSAQNFFTADETM